MSQIRSQHCSLVLSTYLMAVTLRCYHVREKIAAMQDQIDQLQDALNTQPTAATVSHEPIGQEDVKKEGFLVKKWVYFQAYCLSRCANALL